MHDEHERDGGHATSLPIGTTESLSLPVLQAGGFGASVDAFAWEPDSDANPPRMRLWLVSLLGSQQAVKALWAQLIQGETATLSNDHGSSRFCVLAPEGARGWRCFRASLPASGGYHGLLVPELALFTAEHTDFLLLRRPDDDIATLHYRFLNRRVILPLHPSWADWLWNRALRSGEARTLESRGLDAYRCVPDEAALAADLAADIRRGVLSITDENVGHAQPRIPIETIVEKIGHGAI